MEKQMKKWKLKYMKQGRAQVFTRVMHSELTWYLLRQDLLARYGDDFVSLELVDG